MGSLGCKDKRKKEVAGKKGQEAVKNRSKTIILY
jgi:hypothetical protein